MAAATKYLLAPAASTGNNTHAAVVPAGLANDQNAFQFVVEAVGATPTVTFKFQGSVDGTNWYDLFYVTDSSDTATAATRVVTAVGASIQFIANQTARNYTQYRCVTTANTNVTYRAETYVFDDTGD